MKRIFILASMLFVAGVAHADLETDKISGECAGLLTVLQKTSVAASAMEMADNQKRATNFGMAWLRKMKTHQSNGDTNMVRSMIYSASGSCRKIGIRSSD